MINFPQISLIWSNRHYLSLSSRYTVFNNHTAILILGGFKCNIDAGALYIIPGITDITFNPVNTFYATPSATFLEVSIPQLLTVGILIMVVMVSPVLVFFYPWLSPFFSSTTSSGCCSNLVSSKYLNEFVDAFICCEAPPYQNRILADLLLAAD